jgi:hypothetical protein
MQFRDFYQGALVWYHFTEDDNHNEAAKGYEFECMLRLDDPLDI